MGDIEGKLELVGSFLVFSLLQLTLYLRLRRQVFVSKSVGPFSFGLI